MGWNGAVMTAANKLSRAEQKAHRPQEILDAAFEEFTRNGYASTRLDDVAKRLGVTKGTIYLYFPSKEALFEAAIRHVSTPISEMLAAAEAATGSCADRLRRTLVLASELIENDARVRELIRLTLTEATRFPDIVDRHHEEFIDPLIDIIHTLVRQGIDSGEFRPVDLTAAPQFILSTLLHGAMHKLMFDDRRPFNGAAFIKVQVDLVLHGVLANRAEGVTRD